MVQMVRKDAGLRRPRSVALGMTGTPSWALALSAGCVVASLASGCQPPSGRDTARVQSRGGSDFQKRGEAQAAAAAGTGDCYGSCERAFHEEADSQTASEAEAQEYGFGCISRCVIALSDRAGLWCYEAMGASGSSAWQELYLARGLVEKTAFCVREVGDTSELSRALLSAVERERTLAASKHAARVEREALLSGDPADLKTAYAARSAANDTAAWKEALKDYQRWSAPEELAARMFACLESLPTRACGQPSL